MELLDLPLLGMKFTWSQPNEGVVSRLDRILVSDGWWGYWGTITQWVLPRDVSDHYHVIVKYDNQLWGLKPIWFNNHWLSHLDFHELVLNF